jgi:hypothetical protein
MTDCTVGHCAAQHQPERRRAWIIPIIFGVIAIFASMFGDHPPDPNKCPELGPVVTQTVSPVAVGLGCFDPSLSGPKATPNPQQ